VKILTAAFPIDRWQTAPCEVLANLELLNKLRKGGIPAIGAISLHGVLHGSLTIETDSVMGDYIYTWTPDPDYEEDPAAGL
jgi:hypothetical protein